MIEISPFVGEVTELTITIPHIEGIKGKSYLMTINAEDEEVYRQYIPLLPQEVESDLPFSGSILDLFIDEIKRSFLDTQDMVNHRDVMEFLKGKKMKWTYKPMGDFILDVPPIKYLVPKRINNAP